ncbi:MAG: protein BatD [Flavobacteriales bacterium]|nr:protein BatD [Flavobacteriales bacterium]MCC6939883.1 protein BatD [Flavobacteriales bacterium]
MEPLKRSITSLAFALIVALGASAQEISFTAAVDRNTIAAGDQFRLTITLTNAQEPYSTPSMVGLVVMQGPHESSSVNIMNGRMSSSVSRIWILTATQPGKYTIGPARVKVAKGVIETDPITIEVTKGNAPPSDASAAQGQHKDPNLFITVTLSKSKAYVGEQILATYYLYNRYASVEDANFQPPKLTGFWTEEIDVGGTRWEERVVNGLAYRVGIIKQQLLIPQRSGKLRIEPMALTCLVNRSFFNRGTSVEASSNAAEFTATPLPAGAPANFNGAVGELQLQVLADRTKVKENEAIEVELRISGRSNLKLIDAPRINFPSDLETYEPKSIDKINVSSAGMSGTRGFQYTVIPRNEGRFELDPITMSYFDLRSGSYKELRTEPLVIEVSPGDSGPSASISRPSRTDVVPLEHDIRYIHTGDLELRPTGHFLFGSWPWVAGMSAPGVAFLLFALVHRRRQRLLGDPEALRKLRAERTAKQRLREAESALQQGSSAQFHTALSKALHGYLADKFGLGVAEVTAADLRTRITGHEGSEELAESCARILATCDMARFAPVEDKPRKDLYDEAASLIQRLERDHRS